MFCPEIARRTETLAGGQLGKRGNAMEDAFCPRLPEETVMLEEEDKYLFLLPSRPDWAVVNRNAAALLSLCDGKHTVGDLKKALGDHAFAGEALELLDTLHARGTRSRGTVY